MVMCISISINHIRYESQSPNILHVVIYFTLYLHFIHILCSNSYIIFKRTRFLKIIQNVNEYKIQFNVTNSFILN